MILSRNLLKWMHLRREEISERARLRGIANCAKGKHGKLEWIKVSRKKPVPILNQPMEALHLSGFLAIAAHWVGWCTRCGRPVEFASYQPKPRDLSKRGSLQ